jgi:hypothetical protein
VPSSINVRKLGMLSYKQLTPDPTASLIRHRIDMCAFSPALDALILVKNESSAEASTLSGQAELSNFPSINNPFLSARGCLIWLTRVDFLQRSEL